ncbi:OmpW/AlkL family protein [Methyloceanibacter superfactus]|uniref:OmpW/AlkL family protein n=1 Tax=Methyloceanibacter superfactus TaxID=1774969 RepID=UPI000849D05F|nr:OmpW family outer membrane protein [Methyloceanibacter superfactus]
MNKFATGTLAALALAAGIAGASLPAAAGDDHGNFMVRALVTGVNPDTDASVFAGGTRIPGANADVSDEIIPALTLSYFFTDNWAVELFCCFAKHDIDGTGSIAGLGEIADTWIFPPALTAQYHFTGMGAWKPYVGAGVQYIAFFDEGTGQNRLGASSVSIDDAFGFTLQAGLDYSLGNGWYANLDVKKTWLDTEISWNGTGVHADADLDPWIFSAGVGYRFNLSDIFGHGAKTASIPMK